jgi:UDP-N-acetylmuramoyl-tripeptide--D-alanyl-D-alanine ligase
MATVAIPIDRVLEATGGTLVRGTPSTFGGATIDSRNVPKGALFFAVKGERADGHDFAAAAVEAGAAGVVVARGRGAGLPAFDAAVVEVDDVVAALGALGRAHRRSMQGLHVVAITGSNGKTTTKEMVASILTASAGADAVLKTEGNLNNHLGVPLTLLRLSESHLFAVVEMGMSGLGEIAYLTGLAKPDVAVIVSIAGVHLEQLGTIENVARAKAEIFEGLGAEGVAVTPATEQLLAPHVERIEAERRRTFGPANSGATVTYDNVRVGPKGVALQLGLPGGAIADVTVPLIGRHNASNAAAAAAVALVFGIGRTAIGQGLAAVQPAKHRAQLLPMGDRTVLDDCYNAAPQSMRAALDALVEVTPSGAQKIAVLGDMRELGTDSAALHAEVGAYAAARVDQLITLGDAARAIHDGAAALGARRLHTDDPAAAATHARAVSRAGDVILVKASRGMRLERVIDELAHLMTPEAR